MRLAAWKDEDVREHDTLFGPPDSQIYDKCHEGDGFWPCLYSVEKQMVSDNHIHSWKNISMFLDNTRLSGAQVRRTDPTILGIVQHQALDEDTPIMSTAGPRRLTGS